MARWLQTHKGNLKKTLSKSYQSDIDFQVTILPGKGQPEQIMLTPDCFKTLCMQSRTPKAAEVRAYFVAVEATLCRYREDIMASMAKRINVLERNQSQKSNLEDTKGGVIYVIKASEQLDSVYKIGRTTDLAARLRSHSSASADSLDVVYVYKTRCAKKVEACMKIFLKERQYRKYKEVYQIDLEMLKEVISSCDGVCLETLFHRPRASKTTGGYYAVFQTIS